LPGSYASCGDEGLRAAQEEQATRYVEKIESNIAAGRVGIERPGKAEMCGALLDEWSKTLTNRNAKDDAQERSRAHLAHDRGTDRGASPSQAQRAGTLGLYESSRSAAVLPDPAPLATARLRFHPDRTVYAHGGVVGKGGGAHVLRHTFCSHLAMRNAPAKAIQELAGHIYLSTTQRYMHLSPQAREGAIALLDKRPTGEIFGDILETAT